MSEPKQLDALIDFAGPGLSPSAVRRGSGANCAGCIASCATRSCRTTKRFD